MSICARNRGFAVGLLGAALGVGLLACSDDDSDSPADEIEEDIDEGVDEVEEQLEEGVDEVEDELDDMTDDESDEGG